MLSLVRFLFVHAYPGKTRGFSTRVCNDLWHTPTGKEALYGSLDPTTLEWTDGIFTKVLREASIKIPIMLQSFVPIP